MTTFTIVMAIVTAALIGTFGVAMFQLGYHVSGYWEMNDNLPPRAAPDLMMTKRDCLRLLMDIAEEIERFDSAGQFDGLLFAMRAVIGAELAKLDDVVPKQ